MGIDPKMVAMWTDDDLRKEIARQNRNAEYHAKRAAELLQDVREIAAQLSMRQHGRDRTPRGGEVMYDRSNAPCPKCGGETYQDSVDIGVGVIHGPRGCVECAWSEAEEYDLSGGRNPVDEKGGAIDQFGGYHPPGSTMAIAYRMAERAAREGK